MEIYLFYFLHMGQPDNTLLFFKLPVRYNMDKVEHLCLLDAFSKFCKILMMQSIFTLRVIHKPQNKSIMGY